MAGATTAIRVPDPPEPPAPPDPGWGPLIEHVPCYVMVMDRTLRVLWVNRVAEGLTQRDVVGRSPLDFSEPGSHEALEATVRRVFETGEPGTCEVQGFLPAGELGCYATRVLPLPAEDAVMVLASDITERRRAERERDEAQQALQERALELERSNADLEQFAYVASHDLRTPLRTIAGFIDLLERRAADALDDKARRYMDHILAGIGDLQALIDGLLSYSRLSRAPRERWQPVDLGATLDQVVTSIAAEVAATGAEVTGGEVPTVYADPSQMRQLLQNLVLNAIQYRSPDRPPRVRVGSSREGDEIVVAVTDNGQGVHPGVRDRVFDLFRRGTTSDEGGNGLGLALCKKIVERHGGRLWLESELGIGSTFLFSLPPAPEPLSP